MSKSVYDKVAEYLCAGKGGALVTIIEKAGSAPREKGARMFVGDDGKGFGTIGGGLVEAEAIQGALEVIATRRMRLMHIRMDGKAVESEGMVCGGDVDILVEPVLESMRGLYEEIARHEGMGRRGMVVTALSGNVPEKRLITGSWDVFGAPLPEKTLKNIASMKTGHGATIVDGFYIEPLLQGSKLFIFGAGHVSQYVSRIAVMVGFHVSIVDDRNEFANRERFPEADDVVVESFEDVFEKLNFDGNVYIVIVTRGHSYDALVLEHSLGVGAKYVGMIGSKKKVAIVFEHLRKKGFTSDQMKSVYAPIGLEIHSETPEEIGVSIVAQLIRVRGEN